MTAWTVDKTTKIYVPSADFFDFDALKDNSNQKSGPGYFTMQVRGITVTEWLNPWTGVWHRRLTVEGRRYKPGGDLGSPVATAQIDASELPLPIWERIRAQVPAELHPNFPTTQEQSQ